jgi:hypothetical protein
MRIELDVRVIPQLYGTASERPKAIVDGVPISTPWMEWDDLTDDERMGLPDWMALEHNRHGAQDHYGPPPPNGHCGSCLSASLEMMLDYHRRSEGNGASNFHGVNPRMNRKAHPNGDVVNMYWNQALLHHQIWGQKSRLLDFVLRSTRLMEGSSTARVRRNRGMFEAITYSLEPEEHDAVRHAGPNGWPRPVRTEKRRVASTRDALAYCQPIIHHLRDVQEPLLVCVLDFHIYPPKEHGGPPEHWLKDQRPEDGEPLPVEIEEEGVAHRLPWVSTVNKQHTQTGHAMVLAGLAQQPLMSHQEGEYQPWMDHPDLVRHGVILPSRVWVKLIDPSPSLMLEDHPERFFSNPPHETMNPDLHVHWVRLEELLPCIDSERGLMVLRKP